MGLRIMEILNICSSTSEWGLSADEDRVIQLKAYKEISKWTLGPNCFVNFTSPVSLRSHRTPHLVSDFQRWTLLKIAILSRWHDMRPVTVTNGAWQCQGEIQRDNNERMPKSEYGWVRQSLTFTGEAVFASCINVKPSLVLFSYTQTCAFVA